MGLFDIFKPKPKGGASSPPPPGDKNVARLGRVAADRHAQNYDRMEALESLSRIHSSEAATALLKRFTFYIEPSITDEEEKEVAFQGIIGCGEEAVEPILTFCDRADSLTWPLKLLKKLLPEDRYLEEVLDILEGHETDYVRDPTPKVQLIAALEGEKGEDVRKEVERFLEDVSDNVRFQAVSTLLATNDDAVVPSLAALVPGEESVRIRNRIAEGFAARGWSVPADDRAKFDSAIRVGGYSLDAEGRVRGGGA
jgi:hypothetical protein